MDPSVSIIIPVFNAGKTIKHCIESVIGQEFTDFEVILVDDGSTDDSGAVCDEYAEKDKRIRVHHKENTGVSDSRNIALDEARGKYLQFVDSDDWITSDATGMLYRAAEEHHCDMVISDFYRVVGQRVMQKGAIDDSVVMTRKEFAAYMMESPADFYYGVLWNKFFRRDIVEEHHLRMDKDISWCEDFMFNLEYIRHAGSFYALGVPVYYYVKTKGSLVSQSAGFTKIIQMKRMIFSYYQNFYREVFTEEDYEKNRLQVYRFLVDSARDGIVPPVMLPGVKKLGDERTSACMIDVGGEGILMDEYRDRKLLDRYLEPVAIKNNLELQDIRLLLCLDQLHGEISYKELADFANMSRRTLSVILQKLSSRGIVKAEDVQAAAEKEDGEERKKKNEKGRKTKNERKLAVALLPTAEPIIKNLASAQNDYEQAKYAGFSDEELVQYACLSNKIKENIQKVM